MWRYMLWTLTVLRVCKAQDSFDKPHTYYLHTEQLSWLDAQAACQKSGGNVATITDISAIPDMHFEGYVEGELFWIGLHRDTSGDWYWTNGTPLEWNNWLWDYVGNDGDCVLAKATYPYWWTTGTCSYKHAFVCEYPEGKCQVVAYPNSSITGTNDKYLFNKTIEECRDSCVSLTDILCRSFEYNVIQKYCQFSHTNRWINYQDYTTSDPNWHYYHRTCVTGFLYIPDTSTVIMPLSTSSVASSTVIMTSSEVVRSSSVIPTLTSCSNIWVTTTVTVTASFSPVSSYVPPPHLTSSLFVSIASSTKLSPVEEIKKEIVMFKEKKKQLTKVSVPDKRPSSTVVGVSAAALLCVIGALIVASDFLTLARDFKMLKENLASICMSEEDNDENSIQQHPMKEDHEIAKDASNARG